LRKITQGLFRARRFGMGAEIGVDLFRLVGFQRGLIGARLAMIGG
jgi:hypothetical protein